MCTGLYNDMIEYIDEKKKLFLEFFLSTFEVGAVHGSMYLGLGPCVVGACKLTVHGSTGYHCGSYVPAMGIVQRKK